MSELKGTVFANWRIKGEKDPHDDYYNGDVKSLCMGDTPCVVIYSMLEVAYKSPLSIGVLTAGKERLRWLSRKLYKLTGEDDEVNIRRSRLPMGSLTDDVMANYFYLEETIDSLKAGSERIKWLLEEIESASK